MKNVPADFVNPDNLQRGIEQFLGKAKTANWPKDFHNDLYDQLDRLRVHWNDSFWELIEDSLDKFKPFPRYTTKSVKRKIFDRGRQALPDLRAKVKGIVSAANSCSHGTGIAEPDFEQLDWGEVEGLFNAAMDVYDKEERKFVFASKLCHFLLPSCFVIADRQQVGMQFFWQYPWYWTTCRQGWINASAIRYDLITLLRSYILKAPGTQLVFSHYPWGTKISEFCFIGVEKPS